MAINLGDFVSRLKREGQWGQIGNNGDQNTLDILASINARLVPIWSAADWKWNREIISFGLLPNVRQYAVLAASGNKIDRIESLIPYDSATQTFLQGPPLTERTERHFYARTSAPQNLGTTAGGAVLWNAGFPTDYCITQQDANGNWNIIVDPVPTAASKMGGWAKGVLTTYQLADIIANNPILYFPNGVVMDALFDGCMSDIYKLRGLNVDATTNDLSFKAKIKVLAGQQTGVATDDTPIETALPDTVLSMRRRQR